MVGTEMRELKSRDARIDHLRSCATGRIAGLSHSLLRADWSIARARRVSGRRRYDQTTLERLAVIQRARQAGFSLDEIRQLFFGFARTTRPSERWEKLAQRKLAELEALTQEIESMRTLLQESCGCEALDECGKRLLHHKC